MFIVNFYSFVLRPKDPYIDRPLPYVIGSEEWYKSPYAGLGDSSSDSEGDKVSETYSDSESEEIKAKVNLDFQFEVILVVVVFYF